MARKVSADAVQKKAKALGLPPRPRTETAIKPRARIAYQGGGFAVLHAGMPRDPTVFAEEVLPFGKSLIALGPDECRWPGADFLFCGDAAEPDKPYCSRHCARAFLGRRQLTGNEAEALAKTAA